jgi:hypothetical protein
MMTPDTSTCTITLNNQILVAKVVATRWETVMVNGSAYEVEFAFVAIPQIGMVWVPPTSFVAWVS